MAPEPAYLEAEFVSPVNIRFTKLFEKNLPLESDENMKRFQREFLSSLEEVFKQSKYRGNLKYTRDQPQQAAPAGPSTANKVKELLKK